MKQILYRQGQYSDLKKFTETYSSENIFLVRGKSSYLNSGAKKFIENDLNLNDPVSFFNFENNPRIEDLKIGISLFKEGDYKLIIAIGGGSVLDMAKLISVMAHQDERIEDIVKKNTPLNKMKTPLLSVPATAGTGAEATSFAVLYIDKVKYSFADELVLPDYVYLTSEFSLSANPYLTACTGLDAFCQAVESIWSINSNEVSEKFAFEAVRIIWENLFSSVINDDKNAKIKMQEAAFLAGKAINITKTTASHAVSYAFSTYYDIPHGHAVALSLPFFFEFNSKVTDANCNDKRGSDAVKERLKKIMEILEMNSGNVKEGLTTFFKTLNINIDILSLIPDFNSEIIFKNINLERLKNNPAKVTENTISNFLP